MMRRLSWWALTLFLVSGCQVEPYCLTCGDGSTGDMDSSVLDAGPRDGDIIDSGDISDVGIPDGCIGEELCNDNDDDCDGFVDEGFDLTRNPEHCGMCGNRCRAAHAFSLCTDGVCALGDCDIGFYDLNTDPDDGCEYRCAGTETDDSICNLRDDDCDGMVDEDADLMNDPVNCGRCGSVCNAPHSTAACSAGMCVLGGCDTDFYDINTNPDDGCEYACTVASPPDEVCNLRDDDCDGMVDEGDPGAGVACGSSEGACTMGTTACRAGRIACDGEVTPTAELCNGVDDDCDMSVDEGDPEGGRVCGTSTGICEVGAEVCTGGALVCTGEVTGGAETCNGLDDDCDGMTDEGNPGGGATCGSTTGACAAGTLTCTGGALICTGGVGPVVESCDGIDNNCDGMVDEGDPGGGALCGTDVGTCSPGTFTCTAGALVCIGEIGAGTETCDGRDEDCDGLVDEGNPDGGAACGPTTGACVAGAMTCRTGTLVCEGATGPTVELCNTVDDDCDGMTDEDFSLMTDVRNCGSCGTACTLPNAIEACVAGACVIDACEPGFVDLLPGTPGCEYACSFAGAEVCNGADDDCDGVVDEPSALTPPAGFCNPNGVCMGTTASCGGAAGWECVYGATYQTTETRCDTLDNDCDGFVDESFPLLGSACANGIGTCERTGIFVCNAMSDDVACTAAAAGVPADEECNGADDDCDGSIDERVVDDPMTAWRDGVDVNAIDTVTVDLGGGVMVEMMAYEASRADASATVPGTLSDIACSRADTYPWTNVTWDEAQAACCALNPSGTCPAMGAGGWRLCEAPDWEVGCEGPSTTCTHSYNAMCTTSQLTTCNGAEHDCDGATAGDQDCLYNTGSPTFSMCSTDWAAAGRLYDMSGNAREWTATSRGGDLFEVRGGSYNHIEPGRTCQWDFTVADRATATPNTGFRCCMY